MARRGRFGRRRSGSTNLTTLIASLMREQKAAEDRVMFDAYQNGGLVDGKPVTDDRMLRYMEGRRDSFSQDDPLYDEWDNQVRQQKFSIGEQKIGLAFRQGKVGAGAVAAFYRDQLNSIPKNSEFYRTVASRAADWAKSAAGAARGAARGRATAGLRAKLNSELQQQAQYGALEAALTRYARAQGIIAGNQTLTDADATALRDMFDRGIFAGDDRITFEDFRRAAVDQYKALGTEIQIRTSLGQQAVETRNKRQKFLDQTLVRLNTIDERSQYEIARDAFDQATAGATEKDPYAYRAAAEAFLKTLATIKANAESDLSGTDGNDPEFIGALQNEINAMTTGTVTGPTVVDLMSNTGEGVTTSDAATSAESVNLLNADLDKLSKGTAYYGQDEPGGAFAVKPWPVGSNSLSLDNSLQPSVTTINGERRIVYLKGQPVSASVIADAFGNVVDPTTVSAEELRLGLANGSLTIAEGPEGTNVGYVFTNPTNGSIKYGVLDPATGQMFFTSHNPWTTTTIDTGNGLTVFGTGITRNAKGDAIVDPSSAFNPSKPVNIDTADPLLSDSTVAPKDLMALTASGIAGFSEEEVAAYSERLRLAEQRRLQTLTQRDKGLQDTLGIGRTPDTTVAGGGDLPAATLALMQSIKGVQQTILSPNQAKDDWASPPPPPKLGPVPPVAPIGPTPGPAPTLPPPIAPQTPTLTPPPPKHEHYDGLTPPPELADKPPKFNPPPKPGEAHQ